jgi:hypothetical protein
MVIGLILFSSDLLDEYGFFVGIPAAISFSWFMWYVFKLMFGKKID